MPTHYGIYTVYDHIFLVVKYDTQFRECVTMNGHMDVTFRIVKHSFMDRVREKKINNELIAAAFTYCLQGIMRRIQQALLYLELYEVLSMRRRMGGGGIHSLTL